MASRVLKIKCKCRPTPQGAPRPVSNLIWLKQSAHANRYMAPPFDRQVRNAVVVETTTTGPFPWTIETQRIKCTKCQRVHVIDSEQLAAWWGDYLKGSTPSVEL